MSIYRFTYKVTNLVNGKYYLGKHKTTNIDDGYLGSGTNILRAIDKYARENFKREILSFASTDEELDQLEVVLITESDVQNSECYNLRLGGEGGFYHINSSESSKAAAINKRRQKFSDPEYVKWYGSIVRNNHRRRKEADPTSNQVFIDNLKHTKTPQAIRKRKETIESTTGYVKPNLGKIWTNNGMINRLISKSEIISPGWSVGMVPGSNRPKK